MKYILRTLAAGAISVAAKIVIKKIQQRNSSDDSDKGNETANPIAPEPNTKS